MATAFDATIQTPSVAAWTAIVAAIALLLVSAFVSASETAFFSLSASDMNSIAEKKMRNDERITSLLNDTERLLATIQITNTFANVAIVVLCTFACLDIFLFASPVAGSILLALLLALIILVLGEAMPKIYATQRPLCFCRRAATAMQWLRSILYPLSSVWVHSFLFIDKKLMRKSHPISVDELSQALELTDKAELSDEKNMLQGIIRFGEETAKEVMTPRLDVVDLDIDTPFPAVLKCIVENVYSRIPVYKDSRDNIMGILYIKDLLPHLNESDNFRWQDLIRPAYFVPETKMIDDLLRDFQRNRIHIAIVVDEFGGTSGLVTMEDIIEEIVGDIRDEYDEEDHSYTKLDNHTWIFEGKTQLVDFFKITHIDEDAFADVTGDADTLAGLVLELKGEFPQIHEKIAFENCMFEVLNMDERRILKIKVSLHPATGKALAATPETAADNSGQD